MPLEVLQLDPWSVPPEPDAAAREFISDEVRRIACDKSIPDEVALRQIARVSKPLTDWLAFERRNTKAKRW